MNLRMISVKMAFCFVIVFQICVLASEDGETLLRQGLNLEQQKDYAQAAEIYKQIIEQYPDSIYADAYRLKYAQCAQALNEGDVESAIKFGDEIKNLNPSPSVKAEQLYNAGCLFEGAKQFDFAKTFYKQVKMQFPEDKYAKPENCAFREYFCNIQQSLAKGDIEAAKQAGNQIKTLDAPSEIKPHLLYWAGMEFKRYGYLEESCNFYQQILTGFPSSMYAGADYALHPVKYLHCKQALDKGEYEKAYALAEEIKLLPVSNSVQPLLLYLTASLFEQVNLHQFEGIANDTHIKNFDEAKRLYASILQQEPLDTIHFDSPAIRIELIDTLKQVSSGNIGDANTQVSSFIAKYSTYPRLPYLVEHIAEEYYITGRAKSGDEANVFLTKAVELTETAMNTGSVTDTADRADFYYLLGQIHQQLEDYAKAAQAFQNAYQTYPQGRNADYCLFSKGRCYEKLMKAKIIAREDGEAVVKAAFSELVSKFPESPYTRIAKSRLEKY